MESEYPIGVIPVRRATHDAWLAAPAPTPGIFGVKPKIGRIDPCTSHQHNGPEEAASFSANNAEEGTMIVSVLVIGVPRRIFNSGAGDVSLTTPIFSETQNAETFCV